MAQRRLFFQKTYTNLGNRLNCIHNGLIRKLAFIMHAFVWEKKANQYKLLRNEFI